MDEKGLAGLHPPPPRGVSRAAAALLVVLMAAGSLLLWIAVTLAGLWATARLAKTSGEALIVGLPITAAAMIAFAALLVWLNDLYLRVTGTLAYWEAEEREFGSASPPRFLRGPLETLLVASLVIALVALCVWFFAFAHNPSLTP